MLFKSWTELGLRRGLIVTSVVSLIFLLNSVKNLSLTELYMGHSIKKWCSSSTLSLHALQNLSVAGIVGLQYLPVSKLPNDNIIILILFNYYTPKMIINIMILLSNKGNNKITELRTILQRESQNS
jgi:hypothetical protein